MANIVNEGLKRQGCISITGIEGIDNFRPGYNFATHTDRKPITINNDSQQCHPIQALIDKYLRSEDKIAYANESADNQLNEVVLVGATENDPVVVIDQNKDGTYRFVLYENGGRNLDVELEQAKITHILLYKPGEERATLAVRNVKNKFENITISDAIAVALIPEFTKLVVESDAVKETKLKFRKFRNIAFELFRQISPNTWTRFLLPFMKAFPGKCPISAENSLPVYFSNSTQQIQFSMVPLEDHSSSHGIHSEYEITSLANDGTYSSVYRISTPDSGQEVVTERYLHHTTYEEFNYLTRIDDNIPVTVSFETANLDPQKEKSFTVKLKTIAYPNLNFETVIYFSWKDDRSPNLIISRYHSPVTALNPA